MPQKILAAYQSLALKVIISPLIFLAHEQCDMNYTNEKIQYTIFSTTTLDSWKVSRLSTARKNNACHVVVK